MPIVSAACDCEQDHDHQAHQAKQDARQRRVEAAATLGPVADAADAVGEPVCKHEHQPRQSDRLDRERHIADQIERQFEKPDGVLDECCRRCPPAPRPRSGSPECRSAPTGCESGAGDPPQSRLYDQGEKRRADPDQQEQGDPLPHPLAGDDCCRPFRQPCRETAMAAICRGSPALPRRCRPAPPPCRGCSWRAGSRREFRHRFPGKQEFAGLRSLRDLHDLDSGCRE